MSHFKKKNTFTVIIRSVVAKLKKNLLKLFRNIKKIIISIKKKY